MKNRRRNPDGSPDLSFAAYWSRLCEVNPMLRWYPWLILVALIAAGVAARCCP